MLKPTVFNRNALGHSKQIQRVGVIVVLMLLQPYSFAASNEAQATRVCMNHYLSCQKSCKKQQEPKSILQCLNKTCTTAYHYCIDKVNKTYK